MKGDLLSFLKVRSSDSGEDNLSVEEWMKIAECQDNEIQRLESENAELLREGRRRAQG